MDVAGEFFSVAHEEPVLRPVGGGAEFQPLRLRRLLQFPQHIPARTHFRGVPFGQLAFVHLKAVVVLRHREDISGSGSPEQRHPLRRVELLRPEHGDEVLVAEPVLGAVGVPVVLPLGRILDVHISRVPLMELRRDAVHAPVDKNAQLPLPEPTGNLRLHQRLPCGLIGACGDYFLHLRQQLLLFSCFSHGLPPHSMADSTLRNFLVTLMVPASRRWQVMTMEMPFSGLLQK